VRDPFASTEHGRLEMSRRRRCSTRRLQAPAGGLIYATAAIVGVASYLALQALGMARARAFRAGMIVVIALRLLTTR
jgi:hypothetical protein